MVLPENACNDNVAEQTSYISFKQIMDKGKGRGDFATAYKLSRTGDDSSKRVHRRSLEWKETRRDLANKRRNIAPNDLSPVLEGDMSQQPQDKSYKGQTPKKAPTAGKWFVN